MYLDKKQLSRILKDPLYVNSFFIMFNTLLTYFLGFIFWIIIARYYQPSIVGTATAIISLSQLINTFSLLGLGYGLIRFLPTYENKNEIINTCLILVSVFSMIFIFLSMLGINYFSPSLDFIKNNVFLLLSFTILTVISSLYILLDNIYIAFRMAKYALINDLMFNLFKAILPIFVISFGIYGIISSYTIAIITSFIISIIFILPHVYRKFKFEIALKNINYLMQYSFINYISDILWSAPILLMPLLILNVLNADSAAYFYMAYSIATMISISGAVTKSLLVEGSYNQEKFQSNVIKSIGIILALTIPFVIGLLVLGDKLLLIFGKSYSQNATILLILLGVSTIPNSIIQTYITIKRVKKQMVPIIFINAVYAISILLIGFYMMKLFGLVGIGIAWLSSQIFVLIIIGLYILIYDRYKIFDKYC